MRDLLPVLAGIRSAMRVLLAAQRVTVVTVSPLTVQLQDGTTIPAVAVTGLTYTSGAAGIALIADRGQPLVFPTA